MTPDVKSNTDGWERRTRNNRTTAKEIVKIEDESLES